MTHTHRYTNTGTVELMHTAADRIDTDGHLMLRRAGELSLPATNSSDVHVTKSGTSDPTSEQALNEHPDPITSYLPRWITVTTQLDGIFGAPLAQGLRRGAPVIVSTHNQALIDRVGALCDELIRLVHLCRPRTHEAAKQELLEANRLKMSSYYCAACESPLETDPPERTKSGMAMKCYNLQAQWLARGRTDMADFATFKATVIAGVSRGEIHRPASPYWLASAPRHVPEDAA